MIILVLMGRQRSYASLWCGYGRFFEILSDNGVAREGKGTRELLLRLERGDGVGIIGFDKGIRILYLVLEQRTALYRFKVSSLHPSTQLE